MPALAVGAKLHFVDRDKIDGAVERHGLHRGDKITGETGDDFFFARDQRDALGPARFHHPVIDFSRQQPQRQSDHAGPVRQHALERPMRLAGVGGAERRHETAGLGGKRRVGHLSNMAPRLQGCKPKRLAATRSRAFVHAFLRPRQGRPWVQAAGRRLWRAHPQALIGSPLTKVPSPWRIGLPLSRLIASSRRRNQPSWAFST